MGFLDPEKILVVLVIALIVLGPERLPRAAHQLGSAWRELTRVREQVTEEIRSALPEDMPSIPRMPRGVVSGFIADLTRPMADPRSKAGPEGGDPTDTSSGVDPDAGEVLGVLVPGDDFAVPPDDPSMN